MIRCLSDLQGPRHFCAAAACLDELRAVGCLATAQLRLLAERLQGVLAMPAEGWPEASMAVEKTFMDFSVLPELVPGERAMHRSQGGPLAGLPFTAMPVYPRLGLILICSGSSFCCLENQHGVLANGVRNFESKSHLSLFTAACPGLWSFLQFIVL